MKVTCYVCEHEAYPETSVFVPKMNTYVCAVCCMRPPVPKHRTWLEIISK